MNSHQKSQRIISKIFTLSNRFSFLIVVIMAFSCTRLDDQEVTYQYHIDLQQRENDPLAVTLTFNGNLTDTTYFYIPRIIPGI
jgi:hypothetical protein